MMWGNALLERGKLTRLRSDYRDAIDRLNTAISLNPKDPYGYYNLARVYAVQGNNLLAKDPLKKLAEVDGNRTLLPETTRDPDFSGLWKDPDYIELVKPIGPRGMMAPNPVLPR
jgi:tetratricopeptide (TPR) repeat protein